jgi:hypothetical protein
MFTVGTRPFDHLKYTDDKLNAQLLSDGDGRTEAPADNDL